VAISRRDKSKAQSFDNLVCERCSITSRYPSLWEFLTEAKFADGTDRQAPTMTVFVEGRLLKACVNDRAEGMVAFATGSSLTAILEALEEGLQADSLDWRKSQAGAKKR